MARARGVLSLSVKFEMLTFLCLCAAINAAHNYEQSPVWGGNFKDGISSMDNNLGQYLFDDVNNNRTHTEIMNRQHSNSASTLANFGSDRKRRNSLKSVSYPRKRLNVVEQGRTHRNKGAKHASRGLFKNLKQALKRGGLVRGVQQIAKNAVDAALVFMNDTAKVREEFIKDEAKVVSNVIGKSSKLTKNVVEGSINITRKAFAWVDKAMQVGKLRITAPLRKLESTINAAWAITKFGVGLTSQILSDTVDWFQGNWEAVKAMEFPGKRLIVMLYPSGLMSVVNRGTREIMYMLDGAHRLVKHRFAYKLYVSLKIVFGYVTKVMERGGLDCIELKPQDITVNKMLVGSIHTKHGKVCGISHLKPVNNITLTNSDEKFLIISTPWVLEDLSIHLTGVSVTGAGETLLDDETMDTKIEAIKASGIVSFEAGTLLRFVRIHIQVDDMEGFKVRFPTKSKSYLMEYIEELSNYFTGLVRKEINHVLGTVEDKVFDYIAKL